jgi:ribonucleoside-diphosphate reductase beta chain
MPDIYQSRDQILPYEYPEFEHFWESMYKGFWEFGKFDFERDVRDFKLELDDLEREILIRSMLSISVVENKVKSFWANCPQRFPKPEVFNVCYAFSSNEVVHQICYQKVLDLLKVYDRFEAVSEVDCMQGRVKYLNKYLDGAKSRSNKEFTKSLILFTLMTENVSLFSQFFIVSSFFKYKNVLNTFSKVITATMRDELLHGKFGSSLVNIVRKENPEWFDDEMEQKIRRNVRKAYKAELGVLDWIFEKGELSFISKKEVEEYLKSRFNDSLNQLEYESEYELDPELLKKSDYMEVMARSTTDFDFFVSRGTDYSKGKAFGDNLWD